MKILLKSTTKKQNPAKFVYDNFGSLTDEEIISYQAGDIIETAKDFANGDVYKAIELLKESLRVLGVNVESLENDEAKAHIMKQVFDDYFFQLEMSMKNSPTAFEEGISIDLSKKEKIYEFFEESNNYNNSALFYEKLDESLKLYKFEEGVKSLGKIISPEDLRLSYRAIVSALSLYEIPRK